MQSSFDFDNSNYIIYFTITILFLFLIMFELYDLFITKFIKFCLIKYIKKFNIDLNMFDFDFKSFNFSLLYFSFNLKNINVCVKNLFHIEIEQVILKLNRKKLWHHRENKSDEIYEKEHKNIIKMNKSIISSKLFYFQMKNFRLILYNQNLDYFSKLNELNFIQTLIERFVFDIVNVSIEINQIEYLTNISFNIKRVLFAYKKFELLNDPNDLNHLLIPLSGLLKSKKKKKTETVEPHELEHLDQFNQENDNEINSIVTHLINFEISVQKFIKKKDENFCMKLCSNLFIDKNKFKLLKKQTICEVNKIRTQFYFGQLPNYILNYTNQKIDIKNPTILIDLESFTEMKIQLDLWNDLLEIFLNDFLKIKHFFLNEIIIFRLKLNQLIINFSNSNDILFNISSQVKSLEFCKCSKEEKFYILNLKLNFFKVRNFLTKTPLFITKTIYLNLKYDSNNLSVKLNFSDKSYFIIKNFASNLFLFDQIKSKILLKNFFQFTNNLNLIASLNQTIFQFPFFDDKDSLITDFNRISFKIKFNENSNLTSIFIFENLILSTTYNCFNFSSNMSTKCERIIIEMISSSNGSKLQLNSSPIIITNLENILDKHKKTSETNISTTSYESFLYSYVIDENSNRPNLDNKSSQIEGTNFYTHNCLFLNVIQFRYELCKNETKIYSEIFEIIFGDLFGSIDFDLFLQLINLLSSIGIYVKQEILSSQLLIFDPNQRPYRSFRLLTSLFHFNILNLDKTDLNLKYHTINLNIVSSPLNYSSCNFHCINDNPGGFGLLTDLSIKVLCSLPDLNQPELESFLNLVECGTFYFKFLTYYNLNDSKNIINEQNLEFLKSLDSERKYLKFLYNLDEKKCSCDGSSEFFSIQKQNPYQLDKDFMFKPCLFSINKTGTDQKLHFGQSLIDTNEFTLFSYRTFFPEYNYDSFKIITGKKFTVLSHLESNDPNLRKKFEPLEICVYDLELNKFMNETINLSLLSEHDLENLSFKSTNMSPPYFSNEFSIYIRYLPIVKKFSSITYDPKKEGSNEDDVCFTEAVYDQDGLNLPYSDLNIEFFGKTSQNVKKSIKFNWLKDFKKSIKKSFTKKSITLKELSNNYTSSISLSSLSLNSSSNLNLNQNNNKPVDNEKKSSKTTNEKRKKTKVQVKTKKVSYQIENNESKFLLIYNLNLNQILYGFKQNESKISGKKLCVEEVFVQTVYLNNRYEYVSSIQENFLFEKSIDYNRNNNRMLNEPLNSSGLMIRNNFKISKIFVLFTPMLFDCVSKLIEFCTKKVRIDELKNRKNNFYFFRNELIFKTKFNLNDISINILNLKTLNLDDLDEISLFNQLIKFNLKKFQNSTFNFNSFSLSELNVNLNESYLKSFIQNYFHSIESFVTKLKFLNNTCKSSNGLSVLALFQNDFEFKLKILNLIINKSMHLPELQIDLSKLVKENCFQIRIEISSFNCEKSIHDLKSFIYFTRSIVFNLIKLKFNTKLTTVKLVILINKSSLKLNLNKNLLINLSLNSFDFYFKSNKVFKNSKFKYQTSVQIDLIKTQLDKNSNDMNLLKSQFELSKKIIDATLSIQIHFGQYVIDKFKLESEKFYFNFIFPLIFDTKIEYSSEKLTFKIKLPGILGYFVNESNVYQLFDANSFNISVDSNQKLISIQSDKVRLLRLMIKHDLIEIIDKILNENQLELNHFKSYNISLKLDQVIFNYFPKGLVQKNWILLKLFDLEIEYKFKFELNLFENVNIRFKDGKNKFIQEDKSKNDDNFEDNMKLNKSILLIINSSSPIFNEFDLNRWLEYTCLENNEAFGYRINLISALPSLDIGFNFETILNRNEQKISWKFNNNEINSDRNFFLINIKSFELIYNELLKNFQELDSFQNHQSNLLDSNFKFVLKDLNGDVISKDDLIFFKTNLVSFLLKNQLFNLILVIYKLFNLIMTTKKTNSNK